MFELSSVWRNFSQGDPRSAAKAAEEIDDELSFHVRALVEENMARGMLEEEAWKTARQQFGSVEQYAQQTWEIDMGNQLLMQRLMIAGLLILAVLCGMMWFHLDRLQGRHSELLTQNNTILEQNAKLTKMVEQLAQNQPEKPIQLSDFSGRVVDSAGKPLEDVQLLVILKTWPNGRYHQEAFHTKTNSAGQFNMPKFVPVNRQYGIHVAAIKGGYAFKSAYQMKEGDAIKEPEAVEFALPAASKFNLVLQDAAGKPVPSALVAPASRQSENSDSQELVYFQATEPVRAKANAQGEVELPYFGPGDKAKVFLKLPGHDWEEKEFVVAPNADRVLLSVAG